MTKLLNDKYYTPPELAKQLFQTTITVLVNSGVKDITKEIKPDYDYAMCNCGNGCLGKVPEYVGQYAQEVYFYCHNKKYKEILTKLLEYDTIRAYVKSISGKKISVMRLYKYLRDNIEGIE